MHNFVNKNQKTSNIYAYLDFKVRHLVKSLSKILDNLVLNDISN